MLTIIAYVSTLLLGLALGAGAMLLRRVRREKQIQAVCDFMSTVGWEVLQRRVPEEFSCDVGDAVNGLLDAISWQYKVAERRGMEWERAVDALDDVVCVLDSQGRIVRANRALAARIGVDVRQAMGMVLEEVLYKDGAEAEGPIAITREQEKASHGTIASSPLGKNLEIMTNPVRRDYGESMTCVVVREAADERPGVSRTRKLGAMVGAMAVPVVMADPVNGRVIYANRAFTRGFGYSDLDLKGLNIDRLVLDGDEKTRLALRTVAHDDTAGAIYATLARKDRTPLDTRIHGAVYRDEEGRAESLMLMIERAQFRKRRTPANDLDAGPAVAEDVPARPNDHEDSVGAEAV